MATTYTPLVGRYAKLQARRTFNRTASVVFAGCLFVLYLLGVVTAVLVYEQSQGSSA